MEKLIEKLGSSLYIYLEELLGMNDPEEVFQSIILISGLKFRNPDDVNRLTSTSSSIVHLINNIQDIIGAGNIDLQQSLSIVEQLKIIIEQLNFLDSINLENTSGLDNSTVVIDSLLSKILELGFPKTFRFLRFFQIIYAPGLGLGEYQIIDRNRIGLFLQNPKDLVKAIFAEHGKFLAYRFLFLLEDLLLELDIEAFMGEPNSEILNYFNIDIDENQQDQALKVLLLDLEQNNVFSTLKFDLFPLKGSATSLYKALLVHPQLDIQAHAAFDINDDWEIVLSGVTDAFTNQFLSVGIDEIELLSADNTTSTNFDFQISLQRINKQSIDPNTPGFNVAYNGIVFGLLSDRHNAINLFIETELRVGLNISPSDNTDSFLNYLIPGGGIRSQLELIAGWLLNEGLYFNAEGGLEITIPIHKKIGPVALNTTHLYLGLKHGALHGSSSFSFSASLGILDVTVKKLGLGISLQLSQKGNLGGFNLNGPGILAPTGVGASIETGLISGGGFLNRREDGYDGILSLSMKALDLTGIAILTTKMPNGKDGFSLIVSINVIFFPPIQLSFGFTLAGVGGLIGINRTMKVDTLRQRIADGAINSIMFPEDPIKNADRIISDLQSIFPPKNDHFVIAPFLRIGFGTPSVIELDLGVVLEFPFSNRIVLLGSLGIYLPVKDIAIVEIHIDIIGDFNFAEQYIRIEGRLRQSHVLGIALKGGFAFMIDWGRRPAFLFSIGGYHPRYKKPARFPDIPRLSAVVRIGDVVILSCEYYQAISSNSFQIGFSAFLKVSILGASLEGRFSFNALLQFNPFFFSVDMGMSVKIKYKGQTLAGIGFYYLLSGPSPWTAAGYAEITILFITLKIGFRIQSGEAEDQPKTYETVNQLLDRVTSSLETVSNWTAKLPENFRTSETLRPAEEISKEGIILHPSGYLQVRQTALPFEHRIEKYGNSYVREKPKFSFGQNIRIGALEGRLHTNQLVKESFARGQFEDLRNADKLSSPDFEDFVAGMSFGSGHQTGFEMGEDELMESVPPREFEEMIVYADLATDRDEGILLDELSTLVTQRLGNIRTRISRREGFLVTGPARPTQSDLVIAVPEPRYQVVQAEDLAPVETGVGIEGDHYFTSYGEARQFIAYDSPKAPQQYQIMPVYESYSLKSRVLILDDFRLPTNSREIECGTDIISADAPPMQFPAELIFSNKAQKRCWRDNNLRFPATAKDGPSRLLIRTTELNCNPGQSVESKMVRYHFVSATGNRHNLNISSSPGIITTNIGLKYELEGGAFFSLTEWQGIRLRTMRNAKKIHSFVYLFDEDGNTWSNIVNNKSVDVTQSTILQEVEILFDELLPKQTDASRYPRMEKIKSIHVLLVSKGGGDDIVFDQIALF